MDDFTPTKSNLINAQNSLKLSNKAFELLDQKVNVLIKEMMSLISRAREIQARIDNTFSNAYDSLKIANITMGISTVADIALSIQEETDYDILLNSVMGVEIPKVRYKRKELEPVFSFYRTNPAMDMALKSFLELKYLIFDLAEIETSIYKLATEIKKTQKRTNALKNIQIPKYEKMVKFIQDALVEKEREDFARMKIVKAKKKI